MPGDDDMICPVTPNRPNILAMQEKTYATKSKVRNKEGKS
jgi:hypothetical protein